MKASRWEIIHEEEEFLVINKPAGWLSIPDRYDESKSNVLSSLQSYRDQIFAVHRLDKDTSGVMLFAKTERSHKKLSQAFENHLVDKTYHAFVDGNPIENEFTIKDSIAYSNSKKGTVKVDAKGKISETYCEVLQSWKSFSKLACKPKTGRLHQIRIHLENKGYPLMVDATYGNRSEFFISEIKGRKKFNLKKDDVERPLVYRHTLHSQKIVFKHPITAKILDFEAPYPKDLRALNKQLDKWCKI